MLHVAKEESVGGNAGGFLGSIGPLAGIGLLLLLVVLVLGWVFTQDSSGGETSQADAEEAASSAADDGEFKLLPSYVDVSSDEEVIAELEESGRVDPGTVDEVFGAAVGRIYSGLLNGEPVDWGVTKGGWIAQIPTNVTMLEIESADEAKAVARGAKVGADDAIEEANQAIVDGDLEEAEKLIKDAESELKAAIKAGYYLLGQLPAHREALGAVVDAIDRISTQVEVSRGMLRARRESLPNITEPEYGDPFGPEL